MRLLLLVVEGTVYVSSKSARAWFTRSERATSRSRWAFILPYEKGNCNLVSTKGMMLEFTQILRWILSVFFLAPLVFWGNRFVYRRMKSNFSAFSKKKGWPLVTIINGVIYLDEILKALWSIKSSFSTVNRRATKQYWYTLPIYYRSKHEKETESFKNKFRSCDLPHQFNSLTLYALTSVRIFSTLFSIHF